jgi:hypothetical protein
MPHEPAQVSNAVNGLNYTYYENGEWRGFPDLGSLRPVKNGTTGNFGIGPSDLEAGYGLKFSGFVRVPADGVYTFYVRSNELSLLVLDGSMKVFSQSNKREYHDHAALKAGFHAIEVSIYFPTLGPVRKLEVSYDGPGIEKQLIPSAALFRVGDPAAR